MRKLPFLLAAMAFLLLTVRIARTQQPVIPADPHDLFSGGATGPDLNTLTPGPSSPTGTGIPPRVGPNVQANAPQQSFPNGLLGRSETTVASTDDAQLIIVGFNDAQGFCGPPFGVPCTPESPPGLSGYAFSTDAGLTFSDGGAPNPALFSNVFTRGDPWLDRGGFDNETFYYANLAVDATTGNGLGASVHRGHFNGSTFDFEDVRVVSPANPNDFFDKEAFAAAKDSTGAAYLSLTNFVGLCGQPAFGFGQIQVFPTHDAGDTYQGPAIVSPDQTFITDPSNPLCGATGVLQQSSAPAIGPNGEVYVGWQFGPTFDFTNPAFPGGLSTDAQIRVSRSLDGGATFNSPVTVATINSMRRDPPVGYNRGRLNDHPRVAVASAGAHVGRVYVAFYSAVSPVSAGATTQSLVSSQIFVSFSDDRGTTWSTPTPVASAVPATGLKRFWPVVTVEPGGTVDVVYLESQETSIGTTCNVSIGGGLRRKGPAVSLVNTFWVQSLDGGSTFTNPLKMTSATSNWCMAVSNVRPNFGDYIGSTFGGNHVLATWGDGRNGVPDTFYATCLGAGKSP